MGLVDDQERRAVRLIHHETRCARMVGVLSDEARTEIVDDDAGQQNRRRVRRCGDEGLVHMLGGRTGRHPQPDPESVVIAVAEHERLLGQLRRVGGDHIGIHHETTRGDHHGRASDHAGLAEAPPAHTGHRTVIDHQVRRTGLVANLHPEFSGTFE